MKKTLIYICLLLLWLSSSAQSTKEETLRNLNQTAGLYYSYEQIAYPSTAAPAGYKPFYISHYGRHGSRWHASETVYENPYEILTKADQAGVLTALGKDLLRRMAIITADAKDRNGDLSPRGVQEHRFIAEQMYKSYPEVFSTKGGRECNISCRSTIVPRCILSMAAASERLKELNPQIQITREASQRYMSFLSNDTELRAIQKSIKPEISELRKAAVKSERLVNSLFSDRKFVKENIKSQHSFVTDLYSVASIMQDVDYLGFNIYDIFTHDELYTMWLLRNYQMYLDCGPSARFGHRTMSGAIPLLQNFIEEADKAIVDGTSASLRFGHDVFLIPLVALMGIEGTYTAVERYEDVASVWSNYIVSPMATNIQMIFYRKKGCDDVLVKFLFKGKESAIALKTDIAPYYHWNDVKEYFAERMKL